MRSKQLVHYTVSMKKGNRARSIVHGIDIRTSNCEVDGLFSCNYSLFLSKRVHCIDKKQYNMKYDMREQLFIKLYAYIRT